MDLDLAFRALTGHAPMAWQRRLYEDHFAQGDVPSALDIPTGLGKTAVMALWLIARVAGADLPRRLVYVVDRRAVVDQATRVAEELREALGGSATRPLRVGLGLGEDGELPISTLRGQHADNRAWLADPAAPAIIVGTVDMIGSRLLFEGYGASRKIRPYMAGLLGVDALVVLDEAHLVPPFEHMLKTLGQAEAAGARNGAALGVWPACGELAHAAAPLRVLSLSATRREGVSGDHDKQPIFGLKDEDWDDPETRKRLDAKKWLAFAREAETKGLPEVLAKEAWSLSAADTPNGKHSKILVFCDRRTDALNVKEALEGQAKQDKVDINTELLVGARRVFERERVADWLERHGFTSVACALRPSFLIATSAGEVGVDMDADHLVCDLVEWERMIQRLGRVNRRGEGDAQVIVIPEAVKDSGARPDMAARRAPFDSLSADEDDRCDVSSGALVRLKDRARENVALAKAIETATSTEPLRPALTRPLIDAWSMTSLPDHPGRPEIGPWLRGWTEEEPQTTLVWRKHLPVRAGGRVDERDVNRFFAAARPHLLERLETSLSHAADIIAKSAKARLKEAPEDDTPRDPDDPRVRRRDIVLLMISPGLELQEHFTLGELAEKGKDELNRRAADKILALDARLGGLAETGLLESGAKEAAAAADQDAPFGEDGRAAELRARLGWRVERRKVKNDGEDAPEPEQVTDRSVRELVIPIALNDDGEPTEQLHVYVARGGGALEGDPAVARREQGLATHHEWTEREVRRFARALQLNDRLTEILMIAAAGHDSGKDRSWAGPGRDWWQDAMRAPMTRDKRPLAKTKGPVNVSLLRGYRHEFGSLGDIEACARFNALGEDDKDLVRHLIASHHGYARPLIRPIDPALPDGAPALQARARAAALRFVRLQERYGPWRLAWLEALVRAADGAASAANDAREADDDREETD